MNRLVCPCCGYETYIWRELDERLRCPKGCTREEAFEKFENPPYMSHIAGDICLKEPQMLSSKARDHVLDEFGIGVVGL